MEESARIADGVPHGVLEVISSDFGHDGFLLEYQQIGEAIRKHYELFN